MSRALAFVLPDPEHSALARTALVIGYLAAALGWWPAGRRARGTREEASAPWWRLGAFLLFLLAMSKAFNLRAQCETLLRMLAQKTGWYEQRQSAQFILAIVLPALAGLLALALVLTRARQFIRTQPLVLPGWFLLLLYLACRQTQEWKPALSWLTSVYYYQWRLILEVAGIGLVILAACRTSKTPRIVQR